MAPHLFSQQQLDYLNNNLYIISAMYGLLKPFDSINLYRLEMNSVINYNIHSSLYTFWSDKIYKELFKNNDTIINLASKEYFDVIKKHLTKNDKVINIIFGEYKDGKVITKATIAKMARGSMVRFMVENNITDIENIKLFNELNFEYKKDLSDDTNFVFIN